MTSIPTVNPDVPAAVRADPRPVPACPAPRGRPAPVAPIRPVRVPGRRPADRRDSRRPAGRPAAVVLGAPRPAVGGGCPAAVAPWSVVLRRRRAAASAVLVVLLAALAVVGVLLVGSVTGPSDPGATGVPGGVAVTVVGRGESLTDVARRTAPSADVSATVERIRALNALPGSAVPVGRPLTVPVG